MKLRDFFSPEEVARDAECAVTLHPQAARAGAICYAGNEATILRVNRNPNLAAVITTPELAEKVAPEKGLVLLADPAEGYYRLHNHLFRSGEMRVHTEHKIHATATIAATAQVGRHVVIEAGVRIEHHAIIEDYTIIGEGTTVGPNAILGTRGMQNLRVRGQFFPVEWAGGVRIGRNCEILAAAIVQRPYHCEYTEIGDDVRLSVKVNVAHGCRVGARTMIAGNSQLGGNAVIGSDVSIGQSVTIRDGIQVGDRAEIKMCAAVVQAVRPGEVVSGNFAIPHELHVQQFLSSRHG